MEPVAVETSQKYFVLFRKRINGSPSGKCRHYDIKRCHTALHYTHFLTNDCHISESGSRCVIGKCCLVHFQPFNGEVQALMISLYLVLESHLKSQKFQNSSSCLCIPHFVHTTRKFLTLEYSL